MERQGKAEQSQSVTLFHTHDAHSQCTLMMHTYPKNEYIIVIIRPKKSKEATTSSKTIPSPECKNSEYIAKRSKDFKETHRRIMKPKFSGNLQIFQGMTGLTNSGMKYYAASKRRKM